MSAVEIVIGRDLNQHLNVPRPGDGGSLDVDIGYGVILAGINDNSGRVGVTEITCDFRQVADKAIGLECDRDGVGVSNVDAGIKLP